jgi:putative endonuclease
MWMLPLREKQIKGWLRKKKNDLVNAFNPEWLANKSYGTLYTGVTSNLIKRVYQHKEAVIEGFTKKYETHKLVDYEIHADINEAILREKRIKRWRRQWKINLIEQTNPQWANLAIGLC